MFQRQPAPRPHLHFVAARYLQRQPRAHSLRNLRLEHHILNRANVHSGIFVRPMCVLGQMCFAVQLFNSYAHARIRYDPTIARETRFRNSSTYSMTNAKRVLTVAPMPPEKTAYALARYSRSPDSIRDSLEWVRSHDSSKFLESFYFQYGHASIADLGHVTVCFEGVSELAATEIEAEPLWDGQARSSRYQDFSRSAPVIPPEFTAEQARIYRETVETLLHAYNAVHQRAFEYLQEQLPRPENLKPEAYKRNLAARAFDVARYLLPFGVPTGVGQVTSIRTLEKQIRRLKASEFQEVREIAAELASACAAPPDCAWSSDTVAAEPVAPTLARHADRDDDS